MQLLKYLLFASLAITTYKQILFFPSMLINVFFFERCSTFLLGASHTFVQLLVARCLSLPFQIIGTIVAPQLVSAIIVVFHLYRCPRLLRGLFPFPAFCALDMRATLLKEQSNGAHDRNTTDKLLHPLQRACEQQKHDA